MNNTLIKDFILDCLDLAEKTIASSVLITDCIFLEKYDETLDKITKAKNFINSIKDDENIKDEKTGLYVKDIMKKFDSIVENFKEK